MRRPWALPLVPLYGAGLVMKDRLFSAKARRLGCPVVSVGSLSAGGAGKTPVVMALVEGLVRRGFAVDVLSRGYGRGSGVVERVDPEGEAARFGDEPMLLARATGARVFVGADRYAAGLLAEQQAGGARVVHVLDDGFQHRRLVRTVEMVLLTEEDAADWLLPAGNLREPLRRLERARYVVLREEEAERLGPVVAELTAAAVWIVRRELVVPETMPSRPVAFCGIARPEGFFGMLAGAGVSAVGRVVFGDHHAYGERDVERLLVEAKRCGADGFVTTEKDAVKLSEAMRQRLGALAVVGLRVRFVEEDRVFAVIGRLVGG